ncbi:MAG: hypothetical protein IKS20_07135, partial [Victivallales bacterium]|nr:hypothetical protein [Victivallales bacterium]
MQIGEKMAEETVKTELFDEIKNAFLNSFPDKRNLWENNPNLVRCCADSERVNDWIWYEIQHYDNDCWMLRFCVDSYAPCRTELQHEVVKLLQKELELHRYFSGRSYYNAYYVEGRNPITCVKDLEHDLGMLKSKIDEILQKNFPRRATQGFVQIEDKVTISTNDVKSILSDEKFRIPDY